MLEPNSILRYLSNATRFGGRGEVAFGEGIRTWELDVECLEIGLLESDLTREVLEAYSKECPDVEYGKREVPIVICLRWFEPLDGSRRVPLLLMPGLLDVGGTLRLMDDAHAWIPWNRLASDGSRGSMPTVCTIDTLRAHQATMDRLPKDGSWKLAVERAMKLFDTICTIQDDKNTQGTVVNDSPLLRIWDDRDGFVAASQVLASLAKRCDERGSKALSPTLRTLFSADEAESEGDGNQTGATDELSGSKMLCGIPDHLESLSPNDRGALHDFGTDDPGATFLVHAPSGTNSITYALATMANHLTECALRGDRAPVMACTASDSTLALIEETMEKRPPAGQTALPSRWLPRIATATSQNRQKRVLGPLPFFAVRRDVVEHRPDDSRSLYEVIGHPELGDGMAYCSSWYVPQATTYYLDCVSAFLGLRVREVSDAIERLSERLRRVDQDRSELIESYAQVCFGASLLKQRDKLLHTIGALRDAYRSTRLALRKWQQVERDNPVKRGRRGKAEQTQEELIAQNASPSESIPHGRKFIREICEAYVAELERMEAQISELRVQSAEYTQRVRRVSVEGKRCVNIISRLQETCGLSEDQAQRLESTIDGRDMAMQVLDSTLDNSVRPAEFWLAVHIYEGRWLALAQHEGTLTKALDQGNVISWRALANFCPINLIPHQYVASSIREMNVDEYNGPLMPIDFAVALDADEVDVATGMSLMSCTERMLALGSEASLGSIQPQGSTSDEVYTLNEMSEDMGELKRLSFTASGPSSLFGMLCACNRVPNGSLTDIRFAYGELGDLRADLFSHEAIHSLRAPSNSADDPQYPLFGIVPALSHVMVPDSAWQQIGASRINTAEAMALGRWLNKHGRQICERYRSYSKTPIAILTPYVEQRDILAQQLRNCAGVADGSYRVLTLREAKGKSWPVVLVSATCGPQAYAGDISGGSSSVLALCAASAQDALILFWGGAWIKSDDGAAQTYLRHATMVGRLYSVVREGGLRKRPNPRAEPKHMDYESQRKLEVDLRAKPLSLTALLRKLEAQGEIAHVPPTSSMNVALERVGLIERYEDDAGHKGWRPTAAGREIGILGSTDRLGNLFCSYGPSSEPVIASTAVAFLDS